MGGIGGCIDLTELTDDEDDDRPLIVDITSPDPARRNLVPNDLNPVVVRDNQYVFIIKKVLSIEKCDILRLSSLFSQSISLHRAQYLKFMLTH